jgi:hypothetical protein
MSSTGRPSEPKIMSIVTKEALGTLATPMLVAVEAKLLVLINYRKIKLN